MKPSTHLSAVIGCHLTPDPGEVAIEPVNIVGQQPTVTRNVVSVSRQAIDLGDDTTDDPVTVTVRDEESVSRFMAHSYSRTDLIHIDDTWSPTVANAILASSAWPSTAPAQVDLSSRVDLASSALLLGLEPSLSVSVTDGVGTWECEPAGWSVTISRTEISGTINLLDVSGWFGGTFDGSGWDASRWGFWMTDTTDDTSSSPQGEALARVHATLSKLRNAAGDPVAVVSDGDGNLRASSPTGRLVVAPGQTIASAWGNSVWDQSVNHFANAGDRANQWPAPNPGALSFRADAGVLEMWNGTAWVGLALGLVGTATLTDGTSRTSTSFANAADLASVTVTIVANRRYALPVHIAGVCRHLRHRQRRWPVGNITGQRDPTRGYRQ